MRWHITVPRRLAAAIENRFWDNALQKPSYGSRNELIIALLERFAHEHDLFHEPPRI